MNGPVGWRSLFGRRGARLWECLTWCHSTELPIRSPGRCGPSCGEALHPPYTVPLVVSFNALLMAAAWFLLPTKWFDWLFTLHGPLAFAMVMAGWMYSDVPATNVLASDRQRVLAVLDDPPMLSRLLYAQNFTLWCFVAPVCTVVAVIIGYFHHDWPPTLVSVVAIAIVPFGALGVAGWVGIIWPYHPASWASGGSTVTTGPT